MEQSISSIIPHALGQHDQCDASWCGYLKNPDQYKHTGLPGGFDLTGEDLRQNLDRVLQNVAKKSEKLTNIGSSQSNESLNQIISTKVPKAKHFGGSESLNFRVAAGVAQKNVGRQYITDINQKHGLSPGKVTNQTNRSLDEKRKRKREYQKLPSSKLARKKRKVKGFEQGLRNETKEGLTYCPGIALGPDGDKEHMDDLIEIPDPIRPVGQVSDGNVDQNTCMIVFDLETTGFAPGPVAPCFVDIDRFYGYVPLNRDILTLEELQAKYKFMKNGRYIPKQCKAKTKLAIIIPYRDRNNGLMTFLNNVLSRVAAQNVEFAVYLVEQIAGDFFNKGACFNVGFEYAMADGHFDCIVFHDVDVLPEDYRNLYQCGFYPRHLCMKIEQYNYTLPYEEYVGGVITLTPELVRKVNGFSNQYMDWGLEDDDFHRRIVAANDMFIERPPHEISICATVDHERPKNTTRIIDRCNVFINKARGWKFDGLTSLEYTKVKVEDKQLFTHIMISVNTFALREKFVKQANEINYDSLPPVNIFSGSTRMCYWNLRKANQTYDPAAEALVLSRNE